jgi:hypothetical protein
LKVCGDEKMTSLAAVAVPSPDSFAETGSCVVAAATCAKHCLVNVLLLSNRKSSKFDIVAVSGSGKVDVVTGCQHYKTFF